MATQSAMTTWAAMCIEGESRFLYGHMSRTVRQLDTILYHRIRTAHVTKPMWPTGECGHTGHTKYRYFNETLRWPRGLQWALIFAWTSWMTTWAATGIWKCTGLLHDHMGHNCYKIGMKMRWLYGVNCVLRETPVWTHGPLYVCRLNTILYHRISMSPFGPLSWEHTQNTASAPSHPIQHPTAGIGTTWPQWAVSWQVAARLIIF